MTHGHIQTVGVRGFKLHLQTSRTFSYLHENVSSQYQFAHLPTRTYISALDQSQAPAPVNIHARKYDQ